MKPPKDYAKELVEKYLQYTPVEFEFEYAKQCALIDVQNTIDLLKELNEKWHEPEDVAMTSFFDYQIEDFEQVKTEIINLK